MKPGEGVAFNQGQTVRPTMVVVSKREQDIEHKPADKLFAHGLCQCDLRERERKSA